MKTKRIYPQLIRLEQKRLKVQLMRLWEAIQRFRTVDETARSDLNYYANSEKNLASVIIT